MKIDLSKYPPGTKFRLKNGKLAMLVGESPYRKGIYIVEYGDKGGHVDFSSLDGYIIFQDLHIESVIQPDKYLVSYKDQSDTTRTIVVVNPQSLTTDSFYEYIKSVTSGYRQPYDILSWSKIEE
jgi:hypothetical protein